MRMRKKPNLVPRLQRAAAVIEDDPESLAGRWLESFPQCSRIHVELGCGKGRFTADTAANDPETLLLAVERVPDAMVVGMERVMERGIENVRFIDRDVMGLTQFLAPGEAQRIYINFCDPWPKSRDAKRRLTSPDFLRMYASVLAEGGQIHFKTDNLPLFEWSLEQLENEGWALSEVTNDLHENGVCGVMTDYEAKFHAEGIKINRLAAEKTAATKTSADGPAGRLRNASLTDARGYLESRAAFEHAQEDAEEK
jgi:tRNA (guanine-N7-)-methyltransferase